MSVPTKRRPAVPAQAAPPSQAAKPVVDASGATGSADAVTPPAADAARPTEPPAPITPLIDGDGAGEELVNPPEFDPAKLSAAVAEKRAMILEADELIHNGMLTIERARRKYLAASDDDPCSDEIQEVGKCYHFIERQQAAAAKAGAPGSLAASVLRCGPYVERLEKCTAALTQKHMEHVDA